VDLTKWELAVLRVIADRGSNARPLDAETLHRSLPVEHQLSPHLYNRMKPLLDKGLVLSRTMRPMRRACYSLTPDGLKVLEGSGPTRHDRVQQAQAILELARLCKESGLVNVSAALAWESWSPLCREGECAAGAMVHAWPGALRTIRKLGYTGTDENADAVAAFCEGVLCG
jgi:hypothetical protein